MSSWETLQLSKNFIKAHKDCFSINPVYRYEPLYQDTVYYQNNITMIIVSPVVPPERYRI